MKRNTWYTARLTDLATGALTIKRWRYHTPTERRKHQSALACSYQDATWAQIEAAYAKRGERIVRGQYTPRPKSRGTRTVGLVRTRRPKPKPGLIMSGFCFLVSEVYGDEERRDAVHDDFHSSVVVGVFIDRADAEALKAALERQVWVDHCCETEADPEAIEARPHDDGVEEWLAKCGKAYEVSAPIPFNDPNAWKGHLGVVS